MEKFNAFKAKAGEFASSQKQNVNSARGKGNKDEDRDRAQPRHFATIAKKDVSTFEPPPKRVGNIPGARAEDRDVPLAPRKESVGTLSPTPTAGRPAPPLPTRTQSNQSLNGGTPPPVTPPRNTPVPQKLPPQTAAKPPPKVMSPPLPARRESVAGPSQDSTATAPPKPARESTYGQFRNTFGTAVDSSTVNDLRNSLRKTSSASSTASSASRTPASSGVSMSDVRQASSLASKYNKDPNSMTFADAKAGLSVANKVLPRTEDTGPPNRQDMQTAANLGQKWNKDPKSMGWNDLKAGYAVANKFRPPPSTTAEQPEVAEQESTAMGMNDLKSRFANVSLGGMKPPPKTPAYQQQHPSPTSPTGKKAPPPPPKPKPLSLTVLPPIPVSTKPNLSTKPTSWTPKDIPLDLDRGWYSTDPMQQIPYLTAHASTAISTSAISASGSGSASHMIWIYTAVFAIRWTTDLSRTFIRLSWSSEDPQTTVRATQKHFPPPTPLPPADLEKCAGLYGGGVVGFARGQVGRQVGDGECWTLAHDALEFVQQTVEPRCMVSNGKIHGQVVFTCDAGQAVGGSVEAVRTGDIVQYLECKFERRVNGRVVHSSSAGAPDHTAIITGRRADGSFDLLHQNVGGVRKVQKGELILDEMVGGKLWIYRPVYESWAGSLEPKWQNGW